MGTCTIVQLNQPRSQALPSPQQKILFASYYVRGEPGNEARVRLTWFSCIFIYHIQVFPHMFLSIQLLVLSSVLAHIMQYLSKCTTTIARPTLQNKVVAKYLVITNACVITKFYDIVVDNRQSHSQAFPPSSF